jgi:hypothetical protein
MTIGCRKKVNPDAVLGHKILLEYVRLPWEHGSTAEKSSEYTFPGVVLDTGKIMK